MPRQCALCGKKSIMVGKFKKLMASYNPLPKRRKYPNLQWVKLEFGKRIKACAKCIRTMGKRK